MNKAVCPLDKRRISYELLPLERGRSSREPIWATTLLLPQLSFIGSIVGSPSATPYLPVQILSNLPHRR